MVVPGPGDHGGAQGAGRVHAGSSEGDLRRGHTLVRVTMFIYIVSLEFIGDLINYTFLESSEHGESKNVCCHLHRHLQSWGPIDFTVQDRNTPN